MSEWNEIKRPFRDALIAAFNWESLSALLIYHCDRRLERITSYIQGFDCNVDDVIADAVQTGWLEKLAESALAENETHTGLKATVPTILQGIAEEGKAYYQGSTDDTDQESAPPAKQRPDSQQQQTKVLDAAIRREVRVGEETILLVLIRHEDSKGLYAILELEPEYGLQDEDIRQSRPFKLYFPADRFGNLEPVSVEIVVNSPAFDPPTQSKYIEIAPDIEDDDELYPEEFLLTPLRTGMLRIVIEIYQRPLNRKMKIGSKPISTVCLESASKYAEWKVQSVLFGALSVDTLKVGGVDFSGDNVHIEGPVAGHDIHQGDVIGGDKVGGDKIEVGDIRDAAGVAIGRGASATVIQTRSEEEELRDYLATAVARYEARMERVSSARFRPPKEPYKSLYAFDIEDANIFFGRDGAVESLYETVQKDRLSILYARSGAGKSSLLNAGLAPRLIEKGKLPVFARSYLDPVRALKQAIAPESGGPWPALLAELSLQAFLGEVVQKLSRKYEDLVVVLDQFEEFFIFWPEAEREALVNALAECYYDESLPVRFVVALRKEFYSDLLDAFYQQFPSVLSNRFSLQSMKREEAEIAITGPVGRLDRDVSYEQELLDALLDDLVIGEIELPHLQLVCAQLYALLPADREQVLLDDYVAFGRTAGVLNKYLQETLDGLPNDQREVATAVLKALVSSEATKRVMSETDLTMRYGEGNLQEVMAKLVNRRLLRSDELAGDIVYELAHEVLIEEIRGWFDETEIRLKQAEEMLSREVANWHIHGTLIPIDRLELLYEHREAFVDKDSDTAACLLQSAVATEFQVEEWSTIATNISNSQLRIALQKARDPTLRAVFRGLGAAWQMVQLAELGDEDQRLRIRAATMLGSSGDGRAIEPLIATFKDKNEHVRHAAVEALGQLVERAVETLIALLQDKDVGIRLTAAEALGLSGDELAVEPLNAALKDENMNVHWAAAVALGQLGDQRATEPLIAALKDNNRSVRLAAAEALGQLGGERAIEPLFLSALKDEDEGVRQAVAEALGQLGVEQVVESLIVALQDGDRGARRAATEELGELGDERAVKTLIALLQDKDVRIRLAAAETLGLLGDERAVEHLNAALNDENKQVHWAATVALGQLGDERAIEPLNAALNDENQSVRVAAAEALGQLGGERAIELLVVVALKDEEEGVRLAVVEALGQLGVEPAVEPLIAALKDGDTGVRRAAAKELGDLGDERAVKTLIALLQDKDVRISLAAAETLGLLGDERAVEPLIAALKEEDEILRQAAVEALGKLGDERAIESLIAAFGDEDVRIEAEVALVLLGEPAVEPLITALGDVDKDVRIEAALVLGELGDERAVEPLITILKVDDDARWGAAAALGGLGDERAVEPLIAALKDEDEPVYWAASYALGQLGDERAVEPLLTGLKHEDDFKRVVAASALGELGDERAVEPLIAALKDEDKDVRRAAAKALRELGWEE